MGSAITDQLQILLGGVRGAQPSDLRVVLGRLSSEIKERLSRGSPASYDFVAAAHRALARIKGSANSEVRMSCLFDCGAYFYANQFDADALECANQICLLARQSSNQFWVRKGLMLAGIAHAHLGDVGEAVLQFSRSLGVAREMGDRDGEASVVSNLGLALNYAGLYREAIPCFHRAIDLSRRAVTSSYEAQGLCNLAQSYYHLGEYAEGFAAICGSIERSGDPSDAVQCLGRTIREFTYVQLAVELGKLSLAREHARRCQDFALKSKTSKGEFLGRLSHGLCEVHGGDTNSGLRILEKVLSECNDKGSSEYIEALTALVRAYDCALRPELALEHMRLLLRCIRDRRAKSVGAVERLRVDSVILIGAETTDLQALTVRESDLRARVAEREAASARVEMLERFAITADLREEASGEHGYRVGRLAAHVAGSLGWANDDCLAIDLASRLHDIGKIAVPERILLSSAELQEAERHFMSAHASIGAELLGQSNFAHLRVAEAVARHHHEWWNGEGYPSKLKGKRIPVHARIVALADVFDALTHGRPYSSPWPIEKAIEEIKARRGTQFDPELTDVFLAVIERLRAEHPDLDEYLGRAGRNSPFLQARNRIRHMLAEERGHEKKATVAGNETRH